MGLAVELEDYFSFQIFFIILRETIEAAIIVSVLLTFINQNSHDPISGKLILDQATIKNMKFQVWLGAISGFSICLIIGAIFISLFYFIGTDLWSYAERIWEGFFSILSSLIIAMMGVALLRINSMKTKWKASLANSFSQQQQQQQQNFQPQIQSQITMNDNENNEMNNENVQDSTTLEEEEEEELIDEEINIKKQSLKDRYFLVFLPFITTLREGLEAVVFIGGIGVNQPMSSFPLAIIFGGLLGFAIGYILYSGGNKMSIQYFLIGSTCFLYLVAAGLMSRGFWFLELEQFVRRCDGQDPSESGSGPGSYDIANTIWHVNCCNGLTDGGWMIFNALLGWSNTATYGSVSSYLLFWLIIIIMLKTRLIFEKNGFISIIPIKWQLKKINKRMKLNDLLVKEINELNSRVGSITDADTDTDSNISSANDNTPFLN